MSSSQQPGPVVPTWHGWIQTTHDALLILEAAKRGLLPRITRRLVGSEREMITSGSVFVFDEVESGIKRWTDGLFWGPSRTLGNFLHYREIARRSAGHRTVKADQDTSQGSNEKLTPPKVDVTSALEKHSLLTNSHNFKPDGLMKKTFSLTIGDVAQHLISYYNTKDVESGYLLSPSFSPVLDSLDISPEYLDKIHFRHPPEVQVGADGIPRYRGEADDLDIYDQQHTHCNRTPPRPLELLSASFSETRLALGEPDKYQWRPHNLAEDNSSQGQTRQTTCNPKTNRPSSFTARRELQPTFSANIIRTEHCRPQSNPLLPSLNPSLWPRPNSNPSSFSGRHEQSYDSQTVLTQQFVVGFVKAVQGGDLSDEDHQKYLELKDGAVQAANTYRRAISEYKDTGPLSIITKVRKKKQVRKHKRRLRDANADLQDLYYSSADESDASSIAAQSGSPPSSGLVAENIREWRDSLPDPSEQQSYTAPSPSPLEFVHVGHDEESHHFRNIKTTSSPVDDEPRLTNVVVYNDNRIITKHINSGNINHKRIYDSYNSITHSGGNLESYGSVPMDMS